MAQVLVYSTPLNSLLFFRTYSCNFLEDPLDQLVCVAPEALLNSLSAVFHCDSPVFASVSALHSDSFRISECCLFIIFACSIPLWKLQPLTFSTPPTVDSLIFSEIMRWCFPFFNGHRKNELKPLTSTCTEDEMRRSGTELNSQNVSESSAGSSRRNSFPSTSHRSTDLRIFTVSELKSATKNFSRSGMIGEGGFGCVFKGLIMNHDDPSTKVEVAVKQLGNRGFQGHKEWVTEVNVLGVVEHPNLVKLVGYCADDDERGIQRLLVYEFMPNGSVDDHLSRRSSSPLSWPMRLKIAADAARGLTYLHEEMSFQIIFRDFKSSNILLDKEWNAKLSDFGLARLGPAEGNTHVSTAAVGTIGYAAPEYIRTGRLSSKTDVWSYGVFLYELITGRRPVDRNGPKNEQKLLDWIKPYVLDSKKFTVIVDPRLKGKSHIGSAYELSKVANRCLHRHPKSRPKMSQVLEMVNQILEAWKETGDDAQPALMNSLESSYNSAESMNKNSGSRWYGRIWGSKIMKT